MNPEPLASYKSKAYNPGSPLPNPIKEQFCSFPTNKNAVQEFTSFSPDPKQPLKITFSSVRKLKSREEDSEEDMSSPKKSRTEEQFAAIQDFMVKMNILGKKIDFEKKAPK